MTEGMQVLKADKHGSLYVNPSAGFGIWSGDFEVEYDKEYYEKYVSYESNKICHKLSMFRYRFVMDSLDNTVKNSIFDIGFGSGHFLKYAMAAEGPEHFTWYGWDVNQYAMFREHEYLNLRDYEDEILTDKSFCFWDSLEHMDYNHAIEALEHADNFVFISMPIYDTVYGIPRSKHYRPGEHFMYFTQKGLFEFMEWNGFEIVDRSIFEIDLGREDIRSYAFKRKNGIS